MSLRKLGILVAALPKLEFERLYQRAYDNLSPGGWIEHVDVRPGSSLLIEVLLTI